MIDIDIDIWMDGWMDKSRNYFSLSLIGILSIYKVMKDLLFVILLLLFVDIF